MTDDTFDALERRDPQQRERELMARLPALIARAQSAPGWAAILDGVDAQQIDSRAALAQLPITRKADLKMLQRQAMPFGGLVPTPLGELSRVYVSPGPIIDPEGRGLDWWRFARPLHAAGVRRGGLLQNCFSYHFTPAAFMVEGGARRIGCAVIPAGAGQTEMQVQAIVDLRPDTYVGTPSFLRIIIDKAREMGADISCMQRALMGAEALPESLRSWLQQNGVPHVLQTYASADLGMQQIWAVVWSVAGLVALVAGLLWGARNGVQFALTFIALKALPVLILGGFTSVPGAIVGGLIIGASEKLAEVYIGPMVGGGIEGWFPYVLALLFLLVRPEGLFGEKIIRRI